MRALAPTPPFVVNLLRGHSYRYYIIAEYVGVPQGTEFSLSYDAPGLDPLVVTWDIPPPQTIIVTPEEMTYI